jgi:DNA-binding NtrC family response regulator
VVDDEFAWRTILETDLRLLGYQVISAKDAAEALAISSSEPPEAAIVDLMLPDPLDGRALVEKLRHRGQRFPVIFYTAYPIYPPAEDVPGVINYLSKAVDRADLYELIPAAIIQRRDTDSHQ